MPLILTEPLRRGEYLVSESSYQSREVGLITGGSFGPGTVLGRISASSKLTGMNPAASDGSQVAIAILYGDADASAADVQATITARLTEVNGLVMSWPAGITSAQIAAACGQLAAVGIIVRDPPFIPAPPVAVAPVNTTAPAISGSAVQGQTLTASVGAWTGTPAPTYAYQWRRAGTAIAGATGLAYLLAAADVGSTITVAITATNSAGFATASSAATGTVTAASVAPGAVTGLTAGTATQTAQPLSWTAPSTGTAPISYLVEYRLTGSGGWSTSGTTTSLSSTVTGLTSGTAYDYRVTPSNTAGGGAAATITAVSTATVAVSTRARFAQDTAIAGTSGTAAALFASMTQVAGPSSDRNGTMTTTADPAKYTWVAVLASAAGAGMRFFDGTGYGGFNGAASSSIYSGADADPTTIHQSYTDGSGNTWNLYRSSGHSISLTFTLS